MILLLLFACTDGAGPLGNLGGNNDGDEVRAPSRDADETLTADLSDGTSVDPSFGEHAYCWPATQNTEFNGAHVWIERAQGVDRDIYARVTPDDGVDVSLWYAERTGTTEPPNLDSNNTFDCDAAYARGAGGVEIVRAPAPAVSAMNLLIGVAGANGATSGGYTLEIWDEQGQIPDDTQ